MHQKSKCKLLKFNIQHKKLTLQRHYAKTGNLLEHDSKERQNVSRRNYL